MRRKIPSTSALIAFESAARHQSFTKAADELALTQSAVCRQIGSLESFLGVELFRRSRRGVKLTDAGQAYSRRVALQLDAVERDTLAVMGQQGQQSLELAVVPSFGTQWLLPRLVDFQRQQPHVTVNLTSRTRPFLFADSDFDAAIYYGDADWPGTQADFLMAENAQPVCSPQLIAGLPMLDAGTLARLPLLQQSTRPYAWRQWFASQGLQVAQDMSGPRLELFSMLAQAASLGMGMALIPPFLIERELADGRLVCPLAASASSDKAYYLIIPERRREAPALQRLREWLLAEAAAYRQAQANAELSA
ncbi:transcriptional regulator GcvA [Pseudomonas fluvialis]|jgi:DNA-binding transcriptional LysR family regulator|uniref:HTH-type transcriptional regulator TrpI n=1 Tax=Pseudomonas fluvialis TaxID=1793966 RepID=A0A2I0CNF0_9PSED|nr:LysR family transcriptional regulator [Pseudomonas pharmacofabricae]MBP8263614.1 LysR family transcriptional regulator [Pseudomonas sp.]PKF70670.1 LysR family transcriptional regulator [Pseudomonas pharmacofabricae]TXH29144.1 MAG: transcriptional regulator GcvA [Burkholderiaceae bacterium]